MSTVFRGNSVQYTFYAALRPPCVLPNHGHLVAWTTEDGQLSRFIAWLTLTHTQRWHAHRKSAGSGHVYQGRFKAFPVQDG